MGFGAYQYANEFTDYRKEAEEGGPPEALYFIEVVDVTATTSTAGKPILKWKLRILAPSHAGRILWKNHSIHNDNRDTRAKLMRMLAEDLAVCKFAYSGLQDLDNPSRLAELLGVVIEAELKYTENKRDPTRPYQNVYFKRRLTDEEGTALVEGDGRPVPVSVVANGNGAAPRAAAGATLTDDVPF